ncbi:MmcQ/YjbR family DNA-binding protein [Deinococcus sp. Marseille-Q6407]|uniref:MmcQ/YjbR family DNA-binding protein n=1 Tax=Deinococcus sp. Marseille-Q6407 TaxID=2969223 RepID=UPI0021C04114|nr:MmcQ/YjbR family DNA-binding protein [Deinococcus sp. Marseille-Q6407]
MDRDTATAEMTTVAELREFCARLPHSQETFPFGPGTLVWEVSGKMYALCGITAAGPLQVSLKVNPSLSEQLRIQYQGVMPGYHLNKRHWITLDLESDVPPELTQQLLLGSYRLVAAGLTRRARAGLGLELLP